MACCWIATCKRPTAKCNEILLVQRVLRGKSLVEKSLNGRRATPRVRLTLRFCPFLAASDAPDQAVPGPRRLRKDFLSSFSWRWHTSRFRRSAYFCLSEKESNMNNAIASGAETPASPAPGFMAGVAHGSATAALKKIELINTGQRAMANRARQIPEPTLHVLLIYDYVEIAARTHAMLAEAAKRPDDAWVHWEIRPWRLELLFLLPTADLALMDAAGAHLMVFPLGGRAHRSAGLFLWPETGGVPPAMPNPPL